MMRPSYNFLVAAALSMAFAMPLAAQTPLGSYVGSATISGTQLGLERVTYKAEVKISLPITGDDGSELVAEQFGGPPQAIATVKITQWDVMGHAGGPSSDGKTDTWTCTLVAPTDVSVSVSGVLRVDRQKRTQEAFMVLLPSAGAPLNCNHSRSGPYKDVTKSALFFGTSEPTLAPYATQPAPNADRLQAKFVYRPVAEMKSKEGPVSLEWDLVRKR